MCTPASPLCVGVRGKEGVWFLSGLVHASAGMGTVAGVCGCSAARMGTKQKSGSCCALLGVAMLHALLPGLLRVVAVVDRTECAPHVAATHMAVPVALEWCGGSPGIQSTCKCYLLALSTRCLPAHHHRSPTAAAAATLCELHTHMLHTHIHACWQLVQVHCLL